MQLAWLHTLALHLDPVLSLPELTQPLELGEGASMSSSASFQALLVHAASATIQVPGLPLPCQCV